MESTALLEKAEKIHNAQDIIGNDTTTLIVKIVIIFTLYWSLQGLIQLFQRHNSILVIFYLVFLSPIAHCHMLLLGVFCSPKRQSFLKQAKEEAKRQIAVERTQKSSG